MGKSIKARCEKWQVHTRGWSIFEWEAFLSCLLLIVSLRINSVAECLVTSVMTVYQLSHTVWPPRSTLREYRNSQHDVLYSVSCMDACKRKDDDALIAVTESQATRDEGPSRPWTTRGDLWRLIVICQLAPVALHLLSAIGPPGLLTSNSCCCCCWCLL